MRELSIVEADEVGGGLWVEVLLVVIQVGLQIISSSSSGSSATAANGATVDCGDGQEATANATTASCK